MSGPVPDSEVAQIPEDLPPVQPPTAGFIVQLFVVPGLIVAAIVGVWLLFGKLATGEQDWQGLVMELQHPNPHRRWRGALGLAQMLNADQGRGAAGEQLATNREIAQALSDVLVSELKRGGQTEEDFKYEAYLARTLGLFDLPEIIFPAVQLAMQPGNDREVRKNAIGSVAVMTDRMQTMGAAPPSGAFADEITRVSFDDDPLIRELSAYTLGLFPQSAAQDRLVVLLEDGVAETRLNAAIGLARHQDSRGIGVFRDVLQQAAVLADPGGQREYVQFVSLRNCLAAIQRLAAAFNDEQRRELIVLVQPIARDYKEPKIRITAQSTLTALEGQPAAASESAAQSPVSRGVTP
ncbi:MAG: hypothetical protein EXS05_08295 [Planctomycetaceae bacterium]|nr:hypothetical protein [Planctomycetaceae bacterium]